MARTATAPLHNIHRYTIDKGQGEMVVAITELLSDHADTDPDYMVNWPYALIFFVIATLPTGTRSVSQAASPVMVMGLPACLGTWPA